MSKALLNALPELESAGILTAEIADHIRRYYAQKPDTDSGRLIAVFGILGSLLVGTGVILIVAHNWDMLPKAAKLLLAFAPLLLALGFAGFAVWKKQVSTAWREGAGTALVLAIGASISLIAQIYQMPERLGPFLLTWSLLALPVVYVLRSSMASLLYLTGITWYACETGYFHYRSEEPYEFWALLAAALPWYIGLIRKQPSGNFTAFHHWFVPLSVTICLGLWAKGSSIWMTPAYFALYGLMGWIGQQEAFQGKRVISNGFQAFGSLGTIILLLVLSFEGFWKEVGNFSWAENAWYISPEFMVFLVLSAAAAYLLVRTAKPDPVWSLPPTLWVFLVFPVLFFAGIGDEFLPMVITNLLVLGIGVGLTVSGNHTQNIRLLNFGLLVITALIVCRFFDTQIPFLVRGVVFVLVGLGFFFLNTRLLKSKKTQPESL